MKTKIDFVTNSSSTSYVFYGYELNSKLYSKLKLELEDDDSGSVSESLKKQLRISSCIDVYNIPYSNKILVGKLIVENDGCEVENKIDLDDLKIIAQRAKEQCKVKGNFPKLFSGYVSG